MVELSQAEYQRLLDARVLAESTIDTVREPLIVLDGRLKVVSASRSFYQAFHVKPEETENQFIFDLGNKQWDIAALRKLLEEIIPKNENFDNYEVEHDFPAIGRRIMLLNARRIPRPPDKARLILLAFEDVTEHRALEASLLQKAEADQQESKTLFAAVVENIPLMIFLKEAKDLRFVIFNHAGEELLGHDRKDVLGKNILDLFPPDQAANFMAKDREVLDGKVGFVDIPEEPITTAKQGIRILHTRKVCIRGGDGTTKFLLGISEDITERKRAETELKQKIKELEEFYQLTIGRETKMIAQEKETNSLLKELGRKPKY